MERTMHDVNAPTLRELVAMRSLLLAILSLFFAMHCEHRATRSVPLAMRRRRGRRIRKGCRVRRKLGSLHSERRVSAHAQRGRRCERVESPSENAATPSVVDEIITKERAMAKSKSPVPSDRAPSLQRFSLEDLAPFTREGMFAKSASLDFHLFYVGRDDVHGILKYLLSRAQTSLYLNMFGFDDEELNAECMRCALDSSITSVITLDKSQAGGKHEKAIVDSDVAKDPVAFNSHFVIGQSATHQITHTKGGVLDGRVGFEGSTNWSAAGEGTFVVKGRPGGPGYKAQNNTLAVFTDADTIARFTAELVAEHLAARGSGLRGDAAKRA
jgi:phosphatidylserine/phosphatidylglycerophosphate/cardiolipin synthase-like enzyme